MTEPVIALALAKVNVVWMYPESGTVAPVNVTNLLLFVPAFDSV